MKTDLLIKRLSGSGWRVFLAASLSLALKRAG